VTLPEHSLNIRERFFFQGNTLLKTQKELHFVSEVLGRGGTPLQCRSREFTS
jgi:hypothetical protein